MATKTRILKTPNDGLPNQKEKVLPRSRFNPPKTLLPTRPHIPSKLDITNRNNTSNAENDGYTLTYSVSHVYESGDAVQSFMPLRGGYLHEKNVG